MGTINEGKLVSIEQADREVPELPDDHWNRVYTDPAYFGEFTKRPALQTAAELSPFPETYFKRQANIAFLSSQLDIPIEDMPAMYEQKKNEIGKAELGSPTLSDDGLFNLFKKQFDKENERRDAANGILQEVQRSLFTDLLNNAASTDITGQPKYRPMVEQKLNEAGELFNDQSRLEIKQKADEIADNLLQANETIAADARWLFDIVSKQTGLVETDKPQAVQIDGAAIMGGLAPVVNVGGIPEGDNAPDVLNAEMEKVLERFADMPDQQRQSIYLLAGAFAELNGVDKGVWYQAAETLGRFFTREMGERPARNLTEEYLRGQKRTLESGVPLYESRGFGGGKALSQVPMDGQQPLTPEQREQEMAAIDRRLKMLKVKREIVNLADTKIDPIKVVTDWPTFEQGFYGYAGSIPYAAIAAVPGIGFPAIAASFFGQYKDDLLLEYPDLDPDVAGGISALAAPMAAGLELIQAKMFLGKYARLDNLIKFLLNPKRNPMTRTILRGTASFVGQTGIELGQNRVLPVLQSIGSVLDEEIPGYNWQKDLEGFSEELAVTSVTMLLFTLTGLPAISISEIRGTADYLTDKKFLRYWGYSEEQAERIATSLTKEERVATMRELQTQRTPENIAEGRRLLAEDTIVQLLQETPDPLAPTIRRDGDRFTVLDYDGNVVADRVDSDTALYEYKRLAENDEAMFASVQAELINTLLAAGQETNPEGFDEKIQTMTQEVINRYNNMTPEEQQRRIAQWERETGKKWEGDINITAFNTLEQTKNDLFTSITRVVRAKSPEEIRAVLEDRAEGQYKIALQSGAFTEEQMVQWIREYEAATGDEILEQDYIPTSEGGRDVTEAVSTMAVAYYTGNLNKAKVSARLRAFFEALAEFWKAIFARGIRIKQAIAAGQISPEFESFLAQSVGLDPDTLVDQLATKETLADVNDRTEPPRAIPVGPVQETILPDGSRVLGPGTFAIRGKHGSRHSFDRFDLAYAGSGEGHAAYGWGLYVAQRTATAKRYMDAGMHSRLQIDGKPLQKLALSPMHQRFLYTINAFLNAGQKLDQALKDAKKQVVADLYTDLSAGARIGAAQGKGKLTPDEIDNLVAVEQANFDALVSTIKPRMTAVEGNGFLYDVLINAAATEMLQWDDPMSKQPKKVKDALEKDELLSDLAKNGTKEVHGYEFVRKRELTASEFYNQAESKIYINDVRAGQANAIFRDKDLSKRLLALGIKGIRYADGFTRGNYPIKWSRYDGYRIPTAGWRTRIGSMATPEDDLHAYVYKVNTGYAAMVEQLGNGEIEDVAFGFYETEKEAKKAIQDKYGITYNYVIFDEGLVEILTRNGQPVNPGQGSFSITPDKINANKVRSVGKVAASTTLSALRKHPQFDAAKFHGDTDAAAAVVKQFLKQSAIDDIRSQLDPGRPAVVVPVIAKEGTSNNALPMALAERIAEHLSAEVWLDVVKVSEKHNTDAAAADRAKTKHDWSGQAPGPETQMVFVDDTYTTGQTLASLAAYVGEPAAIATISFGRYSTEFGLTPERQAKLLDKAGMTVEEFSTTYGNPPSAVLTGAQAQQYLLNGAAGREGLVGRFPPADRSYAIGKATQLAKGLKGVTYFAGGGGNSLGLLGLVDFDNVVEYDALIAQVYKEAMGKEVNVSDVAAVDPAEDSDALVFQASPSCKGSSKMNTRGANRVATTKDPRTGLKASPEVDMVSARAVAARLRANRHPFFFLENVAGYKGTTALKVITDALDELGYIYDEGVYNAAEHGAPTKRMRYMIRATTQGLLAPPRKVKGPSWYETIKDIINDLPDDTIENAPRPGQEYLFRPGNGLVETGIDLFNVPEPMLISGTTLFKKVDFAMSGDPAFTFMASPGRKDRILLPGGIIKEVTPRAKARMMGFPDWYPLPSDYNTAMTIIGNSIPPAMARNVFGVVLEQARAMQQRTFSISQAHDALKVKGKGRSDVKIKDLPRFADDTKSHLVDEKLAALDAIYRKIGDPLESEENWFSYVRAIGRDEKGSVIMPPSRAMEYAKGNNINRITDDLLKHPEFVEARESGLAIGEEMLRKFRSGELGRRDLASLFVWGLLSRGVGAYPQEGGFLALHNNGLLDNLDKVFSGEMTLDDLDAWARASMKGSPGASSTQNAMKVADQMRAMMTDINGRMAIDVMLDAWKSSMTGPQLRREVRRIFTNDRPSIQIQNKVLSFIILVSGRPDVLVLDRVQFRHMWGGKSLKAAITAFHEDIVKAKAKTIKKYGKNSPEAALASEVNDTPTNIYDALPVIGEDGTFKFAVKKGDKVIATNGIAKIGDGMHGMALYEALERSIDQPVSEAYKKAGISYPGVGAFHWDSWLVESQQAISHPTLAVIAKTDMRPSLGVTEGKFNKLSYGMVFRYDGLYMRELLTRPGVYAIFNRDQIKGFNTKDVFKAIGREIPLENNADGTKRVRPWINDLTSEERGRFDDYITKIAERTAPIGDAGDDGGTDGGGRGRLGEQPSVGTFAISPASYYGELERAVGALNSNPAFRRERVVAVLNKFKRIKEQFANKPDVEPLSMTEAVAQLEAIITMLPPDAQSEVGGFRRLLSFQSPKGRLRYLMDRIAKTDLALEKYLRKELQAEIIDLVENAQPKKGDNKIQTSTLGPDAQRVALMALPMLDMTSDQVSDRMTMIEGALAVGGIDPESMEQLLEEYGLLNMLGNFATRSALELDQARTYLRQTFFAGRSAWKMQQEARRAMYKEMAAELLEGLKKPTKSQLKAMQEESAFIKNPRQIIYSHYSFMQLLRSVLPSSSFIGKWEEMVRKADQGATKYRMDAARRLIETLRDATGKRTAVGVGRVMYRMRQPKKDAIRYREGYEEVPVRLTLELAAAILEGRASARAHNLSAIDVDRLRDAYMAVPLMRQRMTQDGKPYSVANRQQYVDFYRLVSRGEDAKLSMSPAEAIQFLLSWDQTEVQERMRRQGWTDESIEDMRKLVMDSEGGMALMQFLRSEYKAGGDNADPVYISMFGMRMPRIENYAPTRYANAQDTNDLSPMGGALELAGTTPGPLKTRQRHNARMRQEDALSVFFQHVTQMGHWINFAEVNRELRGVLKNPKVRDGMEATFGRSGLQVFDQWLDALAQGGGRRAQELSADKDIWASIMAGKSIASLGFSFRTLFMQVDAASRVMLDIGMKDFTKAMMDLRWLADMPKAWNSETVQRRLIEGSRPEVRYVFERANVKPSLMLFAAQKSMVPMQYLDAALTSVTAALSYRNAYNKAKKAGANDAAAAKAALEAMDKTVFNFSQPVDLTSRSLREVTGNIYQRMYMMFLSDARLKTALYFESIADLGKSGQRAKGAKNIAVLMALAVVNQTMVNLFKDWFDDEPDEEIWTLESYALAMMLAPLSGLMAVGAISNSALTWVMGEKTFTQAQNPAADLIEQGKRAWANLDDTFNTQDPEAMMKQWNRIVRFTSVTPGLAAPAALLNLIKPIEGAIRNSESPE